MTSTLKLVLAARSDQIYGANKKAGIASHNKQPRLVDQLYPSECFKEDYGGGGRARTLGIRSTSERVR